MGSRIMHLIIANRIAEQVSIELIEGRTQFLLGSLAPDAVSTKNESHFFIGSIQEYTRRSDYKGFLEKYSEHAQSQYIWGYYAHLIADDIWLKGFNLSWLRNRMEVDPELYRVSHHDFRLLNGKLLDHYRYADTFKELLSRPSSVLDLDEVTSKEVEAFVPYALGDLEYDEQSIMEQLHVFTFQQIIGYIETAVELGVLHLTRLHQAS